MQHDRDRDGALSPLEMESLFSRCLTPPWGDEYKYTVPTNEKVRTYTFAFNVFLEKDPGILAKRLQITKKQAGISVSEPESYIICYIWINAIYLNVI